MNGSRYLDDLAQRSLLEDLEALRRQASIDVPRSTICVDGRPVKDLAAFDAVLAAHGVRPDSQRCRNALLMCTQAVLATALSIVHNTVAPNIVAEIGGCDGGGAPSSSRIAVDVALKERTVSVTKLLRVVDFGVDGCTLTTDHLLRVDLTLEESSETQESTMLLAMRSLPASGAKPLFT
jgi:hypothetical protein